MKVLRIALALAIVAISSLAAQAKVEHHDAGSLRLAD